MGTDGQAAVDPPAFQSGVIGVGQTRSDETWHPDFGSFSALFAAHICVRAESIFVFSLRVLVVYTSVEEIHFSPLWVDGLRWQRGPLLCLGCNSEQGTNIGLANLTVVGFAEP